MAQPTRTRPAQAPAVQTAPPARDVPARYERGPNLLAELRADLEQPDRQAQLAQLLPAQVPPRRFVSAVVMAVQQTPDLLNKDRQSLFMACLKAARDGLLPDGREAALVPFKDQVSYIRMTQGLLKLARNSGEIRAIDAQLVYDGEAFEYWIDETGPHLRHVPDFTRDRGVRDGCRFVYAIAQTLDGGTYVETLSLAEVDRARQVSRARDAETWTRWWGEMARKTALRRLAKRLPMSTDALDEPEDDPDPAAADERTDALAREARTRERWREQDAAKGYAPRGSAASRAASPQPAPTPEALEAKKRALWVAWQDAGLPKEQPARLAKTSELLESHRPVASWNTLTLAEVEELTAKARVLADERAAAGAASDAPDDAEADREPGDDAPADGPMQEIATDLFPPTRRVGV